MENKQQVLMMGEPAADQLTPQANCAYIWNQVRIRVFYKSPLFPRLVLVKFG